MPEVAHEEARGLELGVALVAAPDVGLEGGRLEADLAVEELVDLVWEKVSVHGDNYEGRGVRFQDSGNG
jgi:hypothetical protein